MRTINYQLSSQKCLEDGWTILPQEPEPGMEEMECFEPQPILSLWDEGVSKVR